MAELSPELREELLSLAPPRPYPAHAILLNQGDQSTHVYLLRNGPSGHVACVKVTASLKDGSETLLGIRLAGDIVGELATLRDSDRSATVTTSTPTVVHAITQEAFQAFLNRRIDAWAALCRMIAERLDWANRRRLDYAAYEVPVRLARVIVELAELVGRRTEDGIQLGVELSQPELGKLIGARTDAIQVAMRRLSDKRLIRARYRKVTILDLSGLRMFADLT
jgi:CRP/FNR family cyclic AMP-dependent transcriptional regulator